MPNPRARVVGSGYTTFNYQGKPIAFLQAVQDRGQAPYAETGTGYEFVRTLGSRHPVEIATTRVLDGGILNLSIIELWDTDVWEQLAGLAGSRNIVDVFELLANNPAYVTCQTIIRPPGGGAVRGKNYHNCVVVSIDDSDTISVGALTVAKQIAIAYTHSSRL